MPIAIITVDAVCAQTLLTRYILVILVRLPIDLVRYGWVSFRNLIHSETLLHAIWAMQSDEILKGRDTPVLIVSQDSH